MRHWKRVVLTIVGLPPALFLAACLFWPDTGWLAPIPRSIRTWQRCEEAKGIYRDALRGGIEDGRIQQDYYRYCRR